MSALHWPYPRVIAHRGAGTLAPENTLAALRESHARGFKAVEFDVMLASDAVPVLMHDPTFGRTVAGRGDVEQTPSSALLAMDAGAWHSPRFGGEPVPSFAAVLRWCRDHGVWANIEIKPSTPRTARETGRVVGEVTRAFYADTIALYQGGLDARLPEFSSFSIDALEAVSVACPEIPRALLVSGVPDDWFEQMRSVGALALHVKHTQLDAEIAATLKGRAVPLMAYTVNTLERARTLFSWGVDAICTDRIDLFAPERCA